MNVSAPIGDTVALESAARRTWDVLVVGAGPAGALSAYHAASRGMEVLLVDRSRFPREKVCGGCLSAKTLARLEAAGVSDHLAALGGPRLNRMVLRGWGRAASIRLPEGRALSRRVLDAHLVHHAIDAGAEFLGGHAAEIGPSGHRAREVTLGSPAGECVFAARAVIDASGLGSRFLDNSPGPAEGTRIGCSTVIDGVLTGHRPGTIAMAVGEAGYVGAVVLEGGRTNVAAALDPSVVRERGVGASVAGVLRTAGFPTIPAVAEARWSGTPPLGQEPRVVAARRLFAVGDAGGYVEPFTGEGIGWAVQSADLLAPLVRRAVDDWSDRLAGEWARAHRREIRRSQRACRILAWVLSRPYVARGLIGMLERSPVLGTPLVNALQGAGSRVGGVAWR